MSQFWVICFRKMHGLRPNEMYYNHYEWLLTKHLKIDRALFYNNAPKIVIFFSNISYIWGNVHTFVVLGFFYRKLLFNVLDWSTIVNYFYVIFRCNIFFIISIMLSLPRICCKMMNANKLTEYLYMYGDTYLSW